MTDYAFRLLNVFATNDSAFSGNQLCVFEDARGLDDAVMLQLAAQFNLSETTFILPSEQADARVRIFTPGYEMKFAGHPTLGTAQVVRDLLKTGDALTLEFKAGVVPVTAQGDAWTFTAPCPNGVGTAAPALGRAEIASLVGLNEDDLLGDPIWIDTGADQLLVPLRSVDAVRARCRTARNWTAGRKAAWDARPRICSLSTKERSKPAGRWSRRAISSPRPAARGRGRGHRLGLRQPGAGCRRRAAPCRPVSWCARARRSAGPAVCCWMSSADGRIQVGGRALDIGRGVITL